MIDIVATDRLTDGTMYVPDLTDNQREAIRKLGSDRDCATIPQDVFHQLVSLDIMGKRPDGLYYLTDRGESLYDELKT